MTNKIKEEPRMYTNLEIDEARHQGFKEAESLYSKQSLLIELNKLKEENKILKEKLNG
jgi:hypothetical protein